MDVTVIIAGAGPVGLMLAGELRLHQVDVLVVDPLAEPVPFSKAFGLHPRSAETVRLRGLVEPLEARGTLMGPSGPGLRGIPRIAGGIPLAHFAGIRTIRLDRLDTSYPSLLPVGQADTEAVLAERATALGARIVRGREVVGMAQDDDGVTVTTDGPAGEEILRAGYLVGCDGGRSAVRKLAGFGFPGTDATITGRLAEVNVPELLQSPGMGWHRTEGGVIQILPGRILTVEFDGPPADRDRPMDVEEMAGSISRVAGRAITISAEPTWLSRFTDNSRLAETYRRGRVLLAGDAAHVHSPFGGQGLNLGLQDAVNLGWKLAAAVDGWAPEGLLDTYQVERRPVAARVLHNTRAQIALMNPDPRVTPLREFFTELMELEPVNRYLGDMITALEVRYDFGGDHPLVGRFLPDLAIDKDVRTPDVFHSGRPVLFDLDDDPTLRTAVAGWTDRVDVVTGAAPSLHADAVLVRPDGYIAWAGSDDRSGSDDWSDLRTALVTWFGEPRQ